MQGFNPLVFGDTATSSLPVAVLRYRIHNRVTNRCDHHRHVDEQRRRSQRHLRPDRAQPEPLRTSGSLHGITMTAPGLPADTEATVS